MRAIWGLGIALLAGMSAQAEEGAPVITVHNPAQVPVLVMTQARYVATEIFAGIGVTLHWGGAPASPARIDVLLETATPADVRPGSLAYSTLGGKGARTIHVFFDRVSAYGSRTATGTVLGHVLAHEIAHVVEGVPRHSDCGIMKANWEENDLRAMLYHPLRFALVDEALIHSGLTRPPAGITANQRLPK